MYDQATPQKKQQIALTADFIPTFNDDKCRCYAIEMNKTVGDDPPSPRPNVTSCDVINLQWTGSRPHFIISVGATTEECTQQ